jgi:hypothetical protein
MTRELEGLRAETAVQLGFGDADLTPAQVLKLDLAVALRLSIDDMTERLAGGEKISVERLVEASETLLSLMPAAAKDDGSRVTLEQARRRMCVILNVDPDSDEAADLAPSEDKRRADELAAENAALRAQLAAVQPASPSPPAPLPPNVTPISETVEQRQARLERVEAINSSRPPAHYLQEPSAAWRNYVGADGVLTPERRMQPSDWECKW